MPPYVKRLWRIYDIIMDTMRWKNGRLILLDQTKLPAKVMYITCTHWNEVRDAIRILAVRGAPAIGVAAAYGMVLAAYEVLKNNPTITTSEYIAELQHISKKMDAARPTAVNLHWALTQVMTTANHMTAAAAWEITKILEKQAIAMQHEDVAINTALSTYGADELLKYTNKPLTILTHCNAGALATAGVGTALGVIRALHKKNRIRMVYADETRPLLQGARLTATELMSDGIPVTLITDNMAAWVMKTKGVDAVIVGADRITGNGDTANKIGTYGVSLLARAHHIPFYVAAPVSTFDLTLQTGAEIPIEERNPDEVRCIGEVAISLKNASVFNPAFDVTPHENIKAIFTEFGVLQNPDSHTIFKFLNRKRSCNDGINDS